METRRARVTGVVIIVLTLLISYMLITQHEFPAFKYTNQEHLLEFEDGTTLGQGLSRFLWEYRALDLVSQAFVLFAAAACCMALLSIEGSDDDSA